MLTDKTITVSLTSRLFADEIAKMQKKLGSILPLQSPHKIQSLETLGLNTVCSRDVFPDYVHMFSYLSKCTLAILEEVNPDRLILTRLDPSEIYQIKNVYEPLFQWDGFTNLTVIPPVFGRQKATVTLESNGFDLVFPSVVPSDLAQAIIGKLLLYNLYSRLVESDPEINMEEVTMYTTNVTHMGRHYVLDITHNNPNEALKSLDELAVYTSILSALIPRACLRMLTILMRHEQHELLDVFRGIVPREVYEIDASALNIGDDITRMSTFITYLQSLSSIFNLGVKLRLLSYTSEALTATCWISHY
ncbi:orf 26 [Ateline gammaherpesvirus 3]|uniref:Orf 26 n=1 Tax=Ateline herpesvirus 3 TaxID=85618 RepID=Q9YTP0_ATHV3|nr:orf 26 [Ateline gammaherpesvirus 3]AAC95550.1 orf 26 [Ateline gammaherpesvirus 3]